MSNSNKDLRDYQDAMFGVLVDGSIKSATNRAILDELVQAYVPELIFVQVESFDGIHWKHGWTSIGAQHREEVYRRDNERAKKFSKEVAEVYQERMIG